MLRTCALRDALLGAMPLSALRTALISHHIEA